MSVSNSTNLHPQSVNTINKILDMEKYNGRVNVLEPENPDIRFQMFEKVGVIIQFFHKCLNIIIK